MSACGIRSPSNAGGHQLADGKPMSNGVSQETADDEGDSEGVNSISFDIASITDYERSIGAKSGSFT